MSLVSVVCTLQVHKIFLWSDVCAGACGDDAPRAVAASAQVPRLSPVLSHQQGVPAPRHPGRGHHAIWWPFFKGTVA